jgi:hypothetical protein
MPDVVRLLCNRCRRSCHSELLQLNCCNVLCVLCSDRGADSLFSTIRLGHIPSHAGLYMYTAACGCRMCHSHWLCSARSTHRFCTGCNSALHSTSVYRAAAILQWTLQHTSNLPFQPQAHMMSLLLSTPIARTPCPAHVALHCKLHMCA